MGATLATLQGEVEVQTKRDDLDAYIKSAINDAILDIALAAEPHELADLQTITATTAGTTGYTLDSDLVAIQSVVLTNVNNYNRPKTLERGTVHEWLRRSRNSADRGVPGKWVRRGNTIHIFDRVPDTNDGDQYAVEIAYIKRPATLTNTTDTSGLDDEYDESIIIMASAKVFRKIQDFEKAAAMDEMVMSQLQLRRSDRNYEDQYDEFSHAVFL